MVRILILRLCSGYWFDMVSAPPGGAGFGWRRPLMQTYSHTRTCPRTGRRLLDVVRPAWTVAPLPTSSLNLRGSLMKAIDANLWPSPRRVFFLFAHPAGQSEDWNCGGKWNNLIGAFTAVQLRGARVHWVAVVVFQSVGIAQLQRTGQWICTEQASEHVGEENSSFCARNVFFMLLHLSVMEGRWNRRYWSPSQRWYNNSIYRVCSTAY